MYHFNTLLWKYNLEHMIPVITDNSKVAQKFIKQSFTKINQIYTENHLSKQIYFLVDLLGEKEREA